MANFLGSIQLPNTAPSLGAGIGSILEAGAKGVGAPLATKDVLERLQRKKLLDLYAPNATAEEREALSYNPDIFNQTLQSGYGSAQQQQTQPIGLRDLEGLLTPQQLQQVQGLPEEQQKQFAQAVQSLPKFQNKFKQSSSNLSSPFAQPSTTEDTKEALKSLGFNDKDAKALSKLDPKLLQEVLKGRQKQQGAEKYASALQGLLGGDGLGEDFSKLPGGLSENQAGKLAELGLKERHHKEKENREAFKFTKKDVDTILGGYKAAKEADLSLNRMEKLNEKGDLGNSQVNSFLSRFNLNLPGLQTADQQEFEKLVGPFLAQMKTIFGARITDRDLSTFLRTIPSLSQTKEGRSRIIRNMKLLNEGSVAEYKALQEVLKQNKNIPPYDLRQRVTDKIEPKLEEIAQRFGQEPGSQAPKIGSKISASDSDKLPAGSIRRGPNGRERHEGNGMWVKI